MNLKRTASDLRAGVKDETSVISTPMPEVPLKAMETTLSFGPLRGLAPAAAVSHDWHKAVSRQRFFHSLGTQHIWTNSIFGASPTRFSEDSEDSDLAVHQVSVGWSGRIVNIDVIMCF